MMHDVWKDIQERNYAQAEEACRQALADTPGLLEARFALAVIAYEQKDPELALARISEVLTSDPNLFPALTLGSRILFEHGRAPEALLLARRALTLRPSDASLHHMVGRCLIAVGNPIEALQVFDDLIRLAPRNAAGYFGRADVCMEIETTFDAVEALTKGLKWTPDVARMVQLTELEASLGRPSLALAAARRVLREDPARVSANIVAGRSLTEQGWLEEAEPYWIAARRESKHAWRVDRQKAYALSMSGLFDESEACLRKSLEIEPRQGGAYQLIFNGRKARAEDRDVLNGMGALYANGALDDDEQAALAFALGKAWDDIGEPERAMSYFDHANALRLLALEARNPFDAAAMEDRCALLRELFPEAVAERPGAATDQPIFVLGMMRSGTSLVEQILRAHPQVTGAGELNFWTGSEALLVDPVRHCLRTGRVAERVEAYLRLLASFGGSNRRVVDKNPANVLSAGLIHRVFPDAPILHVTRNPADVAVSIWMTDASAPFMASRQNIVFAIRQAIRQAEHWRKVLPGNRFLEVPYEELVAGPESWVRTILDFCGLPWHEGCLCQQSGRSNVKTPSLWQVRQPIYKSSVERWRRYEPWLGEFRQLLETTAAD